MPKEYATRTIGKCRKIAGQAQGGIQRGIIGQRTVDGQRDDKVPNEAAAIAAIGVARRLAGRRGRETFSVDAVIQDGTGTARIASRV